MEIHYFKGLILTIFFSILNSVAIAQYCVPTFSTGCTANDYIDDFIVEDLSGVVLLSHLSTGCSLAAYGDYTGDSSLHLVLKADKDYNFKATHGTSSQYIRIWIDFDGNGSFEDQDEKVYDHYTLGGSSGSTTNPTLGVFTIPDIKGVLTTRMRVKTTYSTGASNSCTQSGSWGEAHDYTVTIVGENEDCYSPDGFEVTVLSSSEVEVTWSDSPDVTVGYDWHLMSQGEHPDSDTPIQSGVSAVGDESVTIDSLLENKFYDFYIHGKCANSEVSVWRIVEFFIPSIGADCSNPIVVTGLPYSNINDTALFLNLLSGRPGVDCGTTGEYLYGSDVVYKYTADDDYILDISLENVSEAHTAVFVYKSCADIGVTCATEGSINQSVGDHGFQMLVEDGEDYYFVVSSSEPTDSFNYTLKIDGNTCATYPAPTGGASQDFVDGQKLLDLDVTGINLTWYSDSALANEIDEDTGMVDNTTYYVTQTFDTCESSALAITVNELSCTVLNVVSAEDGQVCGEGRVWLAATGAEAMTNTNIYWFDSATGGNLVGKGNDFQTDVLEQTASFWATEVALSSGGLETGQAETNPSALLNSTTTNSGLLFEVTEEFTLESVTIFSTAATGGEIQVDIRDINDNNAVVFTTKVTISGGGTTTSPVPVVIPISYDLAIGEYRILRVISDSTVGLGYMSALNSDFPYILGDNLGKITSGSVLSSTSTLYYNFFDWTISSNEIICESDRVEVIATVNEVADEIVAEPLPYSHTANTKNYGNNYFGEPGTDCIAEPYLDGNDVVYQFSPSVGAVYSIVLSGLSSNNAGVFVYESCYDIGVSCIAGAVGDGTTADFGINEVILNDGQDYFIVISTKTSSSTDYTITVDMAQIDCADYQDAPMGNEEQMVIIGSTLDDLNVKGANLTWFSDASLTTVLPGTTVIGDGITYYVTQTLNGCESTPLAVTVYELDCSKLEVVNIKSSKIVCKGSTMISAEGSTALGTIYWYEDATTEDVLYVGESYSTPELTQTTSYWVSEVFTDLGSPTNSLASYCTPHMGSSGCNSSDYIDSFTLIDPYNRPLIQHLNSGCASGAYEDLTGNSNLTATLTAGSDYEFTVTHGTSSQYIRIWIDFDGNGSFEDEDEKVYDHHLLGFSGGSTSNPTTGTFTIPQNVLALNTVMRVRTTYSTGIADSCTQTGSWGEVHDYKVTIIGASVICESPRVEVEVEVTPDPNEVITSLPYSHSENTGTYGNIYGGVPGDNCGVAENYLNGSSAVYTYTATDDDLITIELTDLNEYYAGVFVYESCAEIGEECLAGAIAGPSTDDVMIQDFPVEEGVTYYIVVSSWLTNNIDYTLKVNSFSCSDLETPEGETSQQFVAGDTVEDLTAEATRIGAVLTWYEDAGLTQEIIDLSTHLLVDGDNYYITQTINDCESIPLIITANEIDCSDLEIVDYTEATASCRGIVTLKAVASGTGSEIFWYDSATGGENIGRGESFTTPELTQTTSYWVAEAFFDVDISKESGLVGPISPSIGSASGSNIAIGTQRMYFDVFDDIVIESVDIYPTAAIGSNGSVVIRDNNQNVIYDIPFTTIVTGGNTPQTIRLDAELTPGTDYEIGQGTAINLMRNSSGAVFPYTLPGLIELTDTSFNAGYYYWYYNWFISAKGELICESPRQEVIATIDQSGDIQLDYTDLPYLDTNNTSNYGNNFSGAAGDGCMGTNYLNGYEAMYYYEADPNKDDILTIKLSNASNPGGAVFIYDSCGEVGINCLNGAALESGVAIIEDLYIEAGQQLLIVVSSISGTMSYDLEIYGVDCNNLSAPSGNATPYFVAGDMVEDLKVEGSIYNQGFKWYRDATLNSEITDPKNEALIDGTSYFVTQTILDCESTAFEIVPMQFDCGLMAVNPQVEDVYICAPGGEITLKATASGIGNEVIWYDAETDGNLVGRGSEITVNVNANTSYWATEIFSQTASGNPNAPLATYCTPTFNTGCTSRDFIDDFILETSTGGKLIEHLGTGCSPNAYADYTGDSSLSAVLVAGNSYNFIATHGTASQYIRIWIDIDGNGSFEDAGELVYESTSAGSTTIPTLGSFDIPEWAQAGATVMRVKTTWSTGASNSCTQSGAFGEVHDYKVDIIGESVICESFRTEYKIRLNDVVPNPPVVTPLHKICGDGLLSDILVLGDNITWYGANGVKLNLNTPIIEGQRYYVTQTVKGCESATQEVVMHFNDKSDLPVAPVNQSFETGETLQDLTVHGEKLRWYKDRFKTELLNVNTRLVDQTTYYVTQELEEYCESDPLGITVHEVLDIEEQLFEHFEFYPNPVEDILYVVNSEIIEQVEIFDLAGRKVITLIPNKSDLKLNVEELSTGVYLLKAKVEGMERVFRIIKK